MLYYYFHNCPVLSWCKSMRKQMTSFSFAMPDSVQCSSLTYFCWSLFLSNAMTGLFERYNTEWFIYSSCAPSTGFNPQWNCTLSFQLQVPELALVRFLVEDHDHTSKNAFVGQFTLPFTSLLTGAHKHPLLILKTVTTVSMVFICVPYSLFSGYRHVHLLKADGSSLSPATLFIHIKVTRRGVPIKTVSERTAIAKGKAWHASEPDGELLSSNNKRLWKGSCECEERDFCCCCLPAGLPVQTSIRPIYTEPLLQCKMSFIRDEEACWLSANELPQAG